MPLTTMLDPQLALPPPAHSYCQGRAELGGREKVGPQRAEQPGLLQGQSP